MTSSVAALPERSEAATGASADFVVVGAGIAGAVIARLLVEAGRRVTVVAGGGGASHAPAAVVNPVRAKRGKPVPDAALALAEARDLYRRFTRLHLGLYHRVPEEARERWERNLRGSGLGYRWQGARLLLPEAFWLRPRPLLRALLSGIPLLRDRVLLPEPGGVWLASGRFLRGTVVWAAGAEGAGVLEERPALTAGSLLLVAEPGDGGIREVFHAGGVVGGTYRPLERFAEPVPTAGELEELLQKAARLAGRPPTPLGVFSGVRYRRSPPFGEAPFGLYFSGFGSTALLFAPLFARRLLGVL